MVEGVVWGGGGGLKRGGHVNRNEGIPSDTPRSTGIHSADNTTKWPRLQADIKEWVPKRTVVGLWPACNGPPPRYILFWTGSSLEHIDS